MYIYFFLFKPYTQPIRLRKVKKTKKTKKKPKQKRFIKYTFSSSLHNLFLLLTVLESQKQKETV